MLLHCTAGQLSVTGRSQQLPQDVISLFQDKDYQPVEHHCTGGAQAGVHLCFCIPIMAGDPECLHSDAIQEPLHVLAALTHRLCLSVCREKAVV